MLKRMIVGVLFLTTAALAEDPKHMITIGANGLGWSESYEDIKTKSGSDFDSIKNFVNNFAMNYAYRISSRFQLGGFFEASHDEYKYETRDGNKSRSEVEATNIGVFVVYNFSDDLNRAYYLGASAGQENYEEEISSDFANSEGKAALELDDQRQSYALFIGKRFTIGFLDFDRFTYSPQARLFYRTHGKDFEDQGVDYGWGASVEPLRFDLFF